MNLEKEGRIKSELEEEIHAQRGLFFSFFFFFKIGVH